MNSTVSLKTQLIKADKLGIIQELSIFPDKIFFTIDVDRKDRVIEFCKYLKKNYNANSHYTTNFSKIYVYIVNVP